MWANWYMIQWDNFIEKSEFAMNHCLIDNTTLTPYFKKPQVESYNLYRAFMEFIDCAILDVQTLRYNVRAVVSAFIYILLGKQFGQFTEEQILEEFPESSQYLLDTEFAYNNLFSHFLENCCGLSLYSLLPTIQFCSTFFSLPLHLKLPFVFKTEKNKVLEVS